MRKKILLTLSCLWLVITLPVNAAWYEVTGSAVVLQSEDQARQSALEDAVLQVIRYAGADLSSFNRVKPYLKNSREHYQFSGSELRQITVTKTNKKSGNLYLTAQVEVFPSARTCHKVQYKKGLLLGEFDIRSPQHASLGGIYQLGDNFTSVLKRQLETRSQSFVVSGTTRVQINPGYPSQMVMLAEDNDAQYIISGQITDLTSTLDQNLLRSDTINRQFAAELQLLDGKTGEILMQNQYREVANWPFSRTSQVDTGSARFWQSAYGQAVQRVSQNMMLDLESNLACRTNLPEVVRNHGNTVHINQGRKHGVKQGDQLALWHSAGFIDQNGIPRNRMVQTDITLVVDRVYEKSAELSVEQAELANSIQPGDLLTKQIDD
ncbi:flagellar assembly protein FlgT [Photobacterium sp. ZSDE20]|uniref:Flagellar assembly protein FlgT n=1 Tax=Photobacterium pectinilyticum TaxID=2906793 RepID=A0ABT1N0L7_9GAMM|nr:flagellar assembly protein FlgT [Photobacterium sp. ZSDE20]MCQ1058273.1 flagellar assembly protein FlgT [Photobacterium sp. ZSDE20]MDD1823069.1 flagellar assembly protein FlgT [Photobacterium sp. ZSDE20]